MHCACYWRGLEIESLISNCNWKWKLKLKTKFEIGYWDKMEIEVDFLFQLTILISPTINTKGVGKKDVGISLFLYPTLDKIYNVDYYAKNRLSSFQIMNLVACQSLGSQARIFNIKGKSLRLELPKTAKI